MERCSDSLAGEMKKKSWMGVAVVAVLGLSAMPALVQSGDATRGQRVFNQQCRACHTLEKGGASVTGPTSTAFSAAGPARLRAINSPMP